MCCYIVPTAAALAHRFMMNNNPSWKASQKQNSLNMLLFGGALFGIIDHAWNGELLLIGPNIVSDLLLGFTITLSIIVSWAVIVAAENSSQKPDAGHHDHHA